MKYQVIDMSIGEDVTDMEDWQLSPDGTLRYQVHNYNEFWLELAEPQYQAVPCDDREAEVVQQFMDSTTEEGET